MHRRASSSMPAPSQGELRGRLAPSKYYAMTPSSRVWRSVYLACPSNAHVIFECPLGLGESTSVKSLVCGRSKCRQSDSTVPFAKFFLSFGDFHLIQCFKSTPDAFTVDDAMGASWPRASYVRLMISFSINSRVLVQRSSTSAAVKPIVEMGSRTVASCQHFTIQIMSSSVNLPFVGILPDLKVRSLTYSTWL